MDLRQMLIEYGSRGVANQAGIDQQVVSQLISQNVGNIGAQVSGGNLVVSVSFILPSDSLPLSQLPPGTDQGYAGLPRAFVDVNGDGLADYCRFVGNLSNDFIACMLRTPSGWGGQYDYQSVKGIDEGYSDRPRGFKDVNGDGRVDYCRFVGDPPNVFESCNLATPSGFDPNQYTQRL